MANISDMIADFIYDIIGDDHEVQLSRRELADYFAVAPSQINYVLSTRFTLDKGYVIESKRGGGGFITLVKLSDDKSELLSHIIDEVDKIGELSYNRASNIIDRLEDEDIVSRREASLMNAALTDKALSVPVRISGNIRKNIFKEMLIDLFKESD